MCRNCLVWLLTLAAGIGPASGQETRPVPPPSSSPSAIRRMEAKGDLAETARPELAAAAARMAGDPSVSNQVSLGHAYVSAGILDHAFDQYAAAAKVHPSSAVAWEGMARIWRDWGFPERALPDAYRAAYYGAGIASVQNTLGTVLQANGQGEAARAAFRRVVAMDPSAAYAWSNLCYSFLVDGLTQQSAVSCRRALEIDPDLTAARANLALATAPREYRAEGVREKR